MQGKMAPTTQILGSNGLDSNQRSAQIGDDQRRSAQIGEDRDRSTTANFCRESIDFAALIGDVALEIYGEPTRKNAGQYVYGKNGKLVIRLKGNFSDFAADQHGGTLALIEHALGCNRSDAMRWLADRGFVPRREDDLGSAIQRTFTQPLRIDDDLPDRDQAAADKAAWIWDHATPARADHPYLIAKDINLDGLPVREYRGALVVRLQKDGELAGLQFIQRDGIKRFNRGIDKVGAFALIGDDTGDGRILCEGLATGATVYAATGKQVIVAIDAGNLVHVAKAIGRAGDVIAADNDNRPRPDHPCTRALSTYGTGHRKALATGLPIFMPHQPGADFNDIGTEATAEVFARAPISELPTFDAWKLSRIDTDADTDQLLADLGKSTDEKRAVLAMASDGVAPKTIADSLGCSKKSLEKALRRWRDQVRLADDTADAQATAALAMTIALKLAPRSPHQYRLADIRVLIDQASAPGTIHPATMDAIMQRLEYAQGHRHKAALDAIRLPADAWRNHDIERPTQLPTLTEDDLHGGILVASPMGSGKTQIIGKGAADLALQLHERFLAITHRRTLTREQSHRIETDHYGDLDHGQAQFVQSLATCLPSIARQDHAPFIENASVIFIDEVQQCLRFLESASHCRTAGATNADVYEKLKEIVARARCVIAADAGMDERTLRFMEECRPGERFRIIAVREPADAGINAVYKFGQSAPAAAIERGLEELARGGKVYIATEGKGRAARLGELFKAKGISTLCIHADNAGEPEQAAFMADADGESLKYQVVIASPVISSGVSIEHKGIDASKRFTLGIYIGGGFVSTPADAAQQLRRVRYLDQFHLAIIPNNRAAGDQHAINALYSAERATEIERTPIRADRFDHFVAGIRTDEANQRADFASGLLWQLTAAGWRIDQTIDASATDGTTAAIKAAREAADAKRRALIIAAPRLTDAEAAEIEREAFRSELQSAKLEAHRIRRSLGLGIMPIDDNVLDVWDDGAIVAKLDRFNAWQGLAPKDTEAGVRLTDRRHHHARVKAYAALFEGIDISAPGALTPATCELILDRVMADRDIYAHLGIVAAKFGSYREDKHRNRIPMPRPKSAAREVGYLLERMGLETRSRQASCTDDGVSHTGTGTICAASKRFRIYSITAESLAFMRSWAEKRALVRELIPADEIDIGAAADHAADGGGLDDDEIPLPCAGEPASWERSPHTVMDNTNERAAA